MKESKPKQKADKDVTEKKQLKQKRYSIKKSRDWIVELIGKELNTDNPSEVMDFVLIEYIRSHPELNPNHSQSFVESASPLGDLEY